MDYELAKELKEAGFPSGDGDEYISTGPFEQWIYPTLSELIEACGDEFGALGRGSEVKSILRFCACKTVAKNGDWLGPYGHGSTPEEAVARLWITLNTQKNK